MNRKKVMMTPYEVLGIDENASKEEVKEAYRAMIRKYHPDNFANTPEMKEIAEIKTREIIDAYHYILEHFNDGSSERSKEQEYKESTTHRDEDIYDRNGWNKEGINRETGTRYDKNGYDRNGWNDKNGSSIAAFVFGIISVFIMSLSSIFFNLPITVELATSIIAIVIFLVIGPILLIIYFISKRKGDDMGHGLVFLFLLSFFLFFLAPILKIIIVSAIILTIPIISIVYAVKGLNKAKDLNKKGMRLSAIGLIFGIIPILMFILHYAYGVTIIPPVYVNPAAPTVTVSATNITTNSVTLSWAESSSVEGFYVLESTDGNNFATIDSLGPYANSYMVTGLNPGTFYYFEVSAYNKSGQIMTNVVSVQTLRYTVVQTISVGNWPYGVGVDPTTNMIYVANQGSNNVSVINGQTNAVIQTINVGRVPDGVGVNPTTNMIYVANYDDNTVSVINDQTNTVVQTISVGNLPIAVGVDPTTNMIYVANQGSNDVSVINGQTNTVTQTISVGNWPYGVRVNPTTNMIYVANSGDNAVSVINGQINTIVQTISVGSVPIGVGVNPTTNIIYVANYNDGTISVINGQTNTVIQTISVGNWPYGVKVDQITNMIYVANQGSNNVSVINGQTNAVIQTINIGRGPEGVGVDPTTNMIYVANQSDNTVSVIN